MLPKAALTFLVVGVLSVSALTVPVARSPGPEPECEPPLRLSTITYHGLTFTPFNSQTT